mmetsp:Transcript_13144/g.20492  ORF Transcript_13144/g.20492 Transcript_13144/m.20492 type:complete len:420 (-) Transcript_13144:1046-2305(-)
MAASLFKLKVGWRIMVIVGTIVLGSFANAGSDNSENTLHVQVEMAEDSHAALPKKETVPKMDTNMEQDYDSTEHSSRGDEHSKGDHDTNNNNNNRHDLDADDDEEDDEFDDRTLLDTFGEAAKEYLTQRVIPDTDADCKWDWRYTRCEPFCECHLQPKFGDFHLGRSCRYRSNDTTNSTPPPQNFNTETCHLPPETPYVRFAVKALRQTRQASHKAHTVVQNSYQNGKFKVETWKTHACQHMICPSSSSNNRNEYGQHFYRKPSTWKEKFICGSTPPASICSSDDIHQHHDTPVQNKDNIHNRSTSRNSAESSSSSSSSQDEHHQHNPNHNHNHNNKHNPNHNSNTSHPPNKSSVDTSSAQNYNNEKGPIPPPPPSIKVNSIPLSDQHNNGPSSSSSSTSSSPSEPNNNTVKRKSWLWK